MIYDQTAVPADYARARALPAEVRHRWLCALRQVAPVAPGGLVIDIGCGTGRFVDLLADAFEATVIGLDSSRRMLWQAPRDRPLCLADAEAPPFRPRQARVVFSSNVVHHLDNLARFARQARVLLEVGGFVVLRNYVREDLGDLFYLRFFPEALHRSETMLPSLRDLRQACSVAGLRLVAHRQLLQPVAASREAYIEKIARRAYSDLALISDTSFDRGLNELRNVLASGQLPRSALAERLRLLSFSTEPPRETARS